MEDFFNEKNLPPFVDDQGFHLMTDTACPVNIKMKICHPSKARELQAEAYCGEGPNPYGEA